MILSHRESGKKEFGMSAVEAESDGSVCFPYGIVWYQLHNAYGDYICILHSYVVEIKRRQGVRTEIHKYMRELYPDLPFMTGMAATEKSKNWLIKMGFEKKDGPYGNRWYLDSENNC